MQVSVKQRPETGNEIRQERFQAAAHRQWSALLRDDKATFEQRAAAAQKLRESVRVGQ
jgi:hypothetical protein